MRVSNVIHELLCRILGLTLKFYYYYYFFVNKLVKKCCSHTLCQLDSATVSRQCIVQYSKIRKCAVWHEMLSVILVVSVFVTPIVCKAATG